MTYDAWKSTNPDDEFLGPNQDQDDRWFIPDAELFEDGEPDYAGPYCKWPRCECEPWKCQRDRDEAYDKHMDDLRSDER